MFICVTLGLHKLNDSQYVLCLNIHVFHNHNMNSPFNRSDKIRRSPTPRPEDEMDEKAPEIVATSEIQHWMSTIEQCLNEVCAISAEGKLNSDQKLRINNLCRKVGHGTSQMAVKYQSLKQNALLVQASFQALTEKQDLSERLQDLKRSIQESSVSGNPSFADMVKRDTNSFIRPNSLQSVAIYPKDKFTSSDDTKTLVQKIIDPGVMKLHVRGLRKTKNGGVIISTDNKDDVVKLKQSAQLTSSGLTVDEPLKRRPRIVVIGVPTSMQEQEVFKCIYEQNLADTLQDTTCDKFMSSIKLSHKSGKKDSGTCNYIIEVPAIVRKALITRDRVFVNWSSCPVRDFTLVTRCFKCQQYGHAAKSCRAAAHTCGHCGDLGHSLNDCTKKAEPAKCATCLQFKKPSNHKTGDIECPARKMSELRYVNSIDYEGA